MCGSAGSEAEQSGEEAVQQRTCPAVAVLGGTSAAAQNVAGPPQHALQPVAAAPLPPSTADVSTGSQQQGDSGAAYKEQTTTDTQQNSIEEPEEISVLRDKKEAGLVEDLQKLTNTLEGQTPSDRLFKSGTDSVKKQELLSACKTDETSLARKESDMAAQSSTGHCQDWSQRPGDSGAEKGPLPLETIKLECKASFNQENTSGKHTPGESSCVRAPEVSSAVKTTDRHRDMVQSQTTLHFQTNQTVPSSEFIVSQEQSTTCNDSKETVENVMQELPKEGGVNTATKTAEGETQGCSGNSLSSETTLSKQVEEHNLSDEGDCCKRKQDSESASDTQRTTLSQTPGLPTPCENTQGLQQLSSLCENLNDTSKTFQLGKEMNTGKGQCIENLPVDGELCSNLAATEVFHDISIDEPKLSGDGNVQVPVVNERSQVMVFKQNDSAKHIEVSSNHQQDGGILLTHTENCVTIEGLETEQPHLSHDSIDCIVQQSIPADHKLSQIQICLNDTPEIVNVEESQEVSTEVLSEINAVDVKDLIDVGILMQPDMEDTWLVVSEIDGQCDGTEHEEMIEAGTETLVQCTEAQSAVTVYECTVPCFTSAAIHGDVKLLLPEKQEEELVDKQDVEPMETLEEFTPQFSQIQSNLDTHISSNANTLQLTEELTTVASTQKEGTLIIEHNDASPTDLANALAHIGDTLGDQQKSVVVMENTPGVSLISLSTIDPKLLLLNKGDSPVLKQPPSLSAKISSKQNSPVQTGSPSDGSASECLVKTDATEDTLHDNTSTTKKDDTLAADGTVSQTVSTSNVLSQKLHNSQSLLPSSSGDECGENRSKQAIVGTPCQDSMSLGGELEQQRSPDERVSAAQDTQHSILEPLDASIEESSDGEADSSMEVQNDDSNTMPSPAPNKVKVCI